MFQFATYFMIVICACSNVALAKDIVLARGLSYDCKTFLVQATANIITIDCKLQS
jgi:hypothetical protein